MNTNTLLAKAGVIFLVLVSILYACPGRPPEKYTLLATYGDNPDETKTVSVGETVTFNGTGKFYCPYYNGSIVEYKWILPSQAYCISGQNSATLKCKFYPKSSTSVPYYDVELQVRCIHGVWNTNYYSSQGSYPIYNRYFVRVTVNGVSPVPFTWYVRPDGSDYNNGQSDSVGGSPNYIGAFQAIQTAINSADDGDEIIVREGTYHERLDLKGKSLNIHSEFPDDWAKVQSTIIDADEEGGAVVFRGSETGANGAQLKGFKITGGSSDGASQGLIGRWRLNGNADDSLGSYSGTIYVDGAVVPPAIPSWDNGVKGQAIILNGGDAVYIEGSDDPGSPFNNLTNVTLNAWIKIPYPGGGGIIVSRSSPNDTTFHLGVWGSGVVFMSRYAGYYQSWSMSTSSIVQPNTWYHVVGVIDDDSNMAYINVDGQLKAQSPILVERTACLNMVKIGCRNDTADYSFVGQIDEVSIYNRALNESDVFRLDMWGGITGNGTTANISQCIVTGNSGGISHVDGTIQNCSILNNSSLTDGGGLANCDGKIINCVVAGNSAPNAGAMDDCDGNIVNCTIANNTAITSVGGIQGCDGTVTNSILWGNSDSDAGTNVQQCQINNSNATVSYSCVQDNTEDEDVYSGDGNIDKNPLFKSDGYHLSSDSPCINRGNDYNLESLLPLVDMDNQNRIMDSVLDIGADEVPLVLYVNKSATGTIHDGSSWAKAYTNFQDALAFAGSSSQVWVAEGVYTPDVGGGKTLHDRTASFQLIERIEIYGGFAGTETILSERNWNANPTILSGDLNQDDYSGGSSAENSYHVVKGADNAVLDGFRIAAGNANGTGINANGAGIYNDAVTVTLQNCVLIANHANQYGGAIYNKDCDPSMVISGCNVIYNSVGTAGGGMYNDDSKAIVTNSIFWGNTPTDNGSITNTGTSTAVFSYCDIQNCGESGVTWNSNVGTDGGNNIAADPLFINYDGTDNYPGTVDDDSSLDPESPCSDGGVADMDMGSGPQSPTEILNEVTVTDPVGIAVYNDLIYVLSASEHAVYVFDEQLVLQTDYFNNGVLVVDAVNPKGICVDGDYWGYIYVVDTGNHRILRYYDYYGGLDTGFADYGFLGTYGTGDGQFDSPCNIQIGSENKLYVTDSGNNRVQIFDIYGTFLAKYGQAGSGAGQFNIPSGLSIFEQPMTTLFVADKNNHRIQWLDGTTGDCIDQFGSQGSDSGNLNAPSGVWYDLQCDFVFVADTSNNRIQILQSSSGEINFVKSINDLELLNPSSVACVNSETRDICIADTGNNRIVKFRVELDEPANRPLFIWESFKNALRADDIPTALSFISEQSQADYGTILPALEPYFDDMVDGMGVLLLKYKTDNTVLYEMLHDEGEGVIASYPVFFVMDIDGKWKIDCF